MVDYSLAGSAALGATTGNGLAASTTSAAGLGAAAKGMDPAKKMMVAQMLMGGMKDLAAAGHQQVQAPQVQFRDR